VPRPPGDVTHVGTQAMTDGELSEPRYAWQSNDSDVRVGYLSVKGRITVSELIHELAKLAPDATLHDINTNFATVSWTRPATAEEIEQRKAQRAASDARREKWERENYERLREKYGDHA
jgi:hypothetical protein